MHMAHLGPPASLTVTPRRLVLTGRGDSGVIRIHTHSAAGFTTEPEPCDVGFAHDTSLLDVAPHPRAPRGESDADGPTPAPTPPVVPTDPKPGAAATDWRVTAHVDTAATRVDVTVGQLSASVAVAVGIRTRRLTTTADEWRLRTTRADGELRRASGDTEPTIARPPDSDLIDGPGAAASTPVTTTHGQPHDASIDPPPAHDVPRTHVELSYDFTASTATRTVHADLTSPILIDGRPERLNVWIDADGHGAWPSLECRDADGTRVVLRGEHLDRAGPRRHSMPVPPTAAHPLRLHGFYLAETRPGHRYRGRIRFGDITAASAPATEVADGDAGLPFPVWYPRGGPAAGPLFTDDLTDRRWRFAVVSDTQFVAARPRDRLVAAARAVLRDIAAARPDLVLVNGDFVDEGSPADLALARRILDEELADGPPWVYIPGNHEIAGGDIATFTAAFGPPRRQFDHRDVRFLTLDTSSLSIGAAQFTWLRDELARAADDAAVAAVVVVGHVPPHDPTGHDASRLVDRAEATELETTLADFAATGRGCAYIAGHAGGFATWLRDGVGYVVNGNSGKHPAVPPHTGGLLGWSECGVGPVRSTRDRADTARRAPDWLAVRVRAT